MYHCTLRSQRGTLSLTTLLTLTATLLLPSTARAQFITNSPDPFQGSIVTLQTTVPTFFGLGYAQTAKLSNIAETGNNIVAGNDEIDYNALLTATYYTTPALTTPAGSIALMGDFGVTLSGRTSPFETGTFPYTVDTVTFSGNVAGHTLTIQLNPAQISEGMATITAGPGVGQYTITAPALVYGERIVDGKSPIPGPVFTLTVGTPPSSVPEPGVVPLATLSGIAGLLAWRRTKRPN